MFKVTSSKTATENTEFTEKDEKSRNLSLAPPLEEGLKPVAEPQTGLFLVSELGGDGPEADPLATLAHDEACSVTCAGYGVGDDRVVRVGFSTVWACDGDLVFHTALLSWVI